MRMKESFDDQETENRKSTSSDIADNTIESNSFSIDIKELRERRRIVAEYEMCIRDRTSILTTMKGIPLAYNKDMQEDKELTFDAIDTVKGCIALFTGMVSTCLLYTSRCV